MTKRALVVAALALSASACLPPAAPIAPPPHVPVPARAVVRTFDISLCNGLTTIADAAGRPMTNCRQPIVGQVIRINTHVSPADNHDETTNQDGFTGWSLDDATGDASIFVTVDGYQPFDSGTIHLADYSARGHNFIDLQASHVDPSTFSLEQLAGMLRGAMWTSRLNVPYGPRPGQDSNILAMPYFGLFDAPTQERMLRHYHDEQGYTAAVTGPITGNDCYHGKYPCRQGIPTQAQWDAYLDELQAWWDRGVAPVYFAKPDGAENDPATLTALDALERQPRAQQLIRIVIEPGWEPSGSKYGWPNDTYVRMLKRGADNFPNALRGLHTVADLDAPLGGDDDPVAQLPDNKAVAWQRVLPYMHFWAVQVGGYVDENTPTPSAHFLDQFAKLWPDYNRRFQTDAGGWHFPSAWSNGRPVLVGYAEGAAYRDFWDNFPESVAQDLGDLAIASGAAFYLDGGRVPVPAVH